MWCTCVCISLLHALNYLDNLIIKKLSQYEEDFKHEREDRIRATEARDRIEKEFKDYKEANEVQLTQLNNRVS